MLLELLTIVSLLTNPKRFSYTAFAFSFHVSTCTYTCAPPATLTVQSHTRAAANSAA